MKKLPITVIMITLNEEYHLADVINNVKPWAEDIFIVDSLSTDRTVDIALNSGIKIIQNPFKNFGDQWNFALERLPIRTPWTMKLDPDERVSERLICELERVTLCRTHYSHFCMDRRLWFMGRPLHVKQPIVRLWKTGKCKFSDVIVNEHPIVEGEMGKLKGYIEHYDSPNLYHWVEKQNRYTTMLAVQKAKGQKLSVKPRLFGSPLERRMFLIKYFFKLPLRYQLQWIHEVFVRGVWRDGAIGLSWARLRVEARRMRELKTKEILMTGIVPEIPIAKHGDFDSRILESLLQQMVSVNTNSKNI